MDQFIAVVENSHKQFSKEKVCLQTREISIQAAMFKTMIPHLYKRPKSIKWGYKTLRLYYKMAKDKRILKYWSTQEWKYWKKILVYLTRHLPPKKGIAIAA